ncbi:MAG: nucleotidyl transferase AbiEii/AbiGii toxin family protein [Phenylobacterium sp.]|nr:nucleotidyl transferase AbiEii/AbiGii toxin family protein [Phenylobacterium sp.]
MALLVRLLPAIAREPVFALKGGTAINLFVRDLPRLSVDIDLTYLPVEPRDASLKGIDAALERIMVNIKKTIGGAQVHVQRSVEGHIERLHVQAGVTVKIEVTPVLRGVVFDPVTIASPEASRIAMASPRPWWSRRPTSTPANSSRPSTDSTRATSST